MLFLALLSVLSSSEAMWYEKLPNRWVQCKLCFRKCKIPSGGRGFCQARENRDGILYSLGYGRPCAVHIDPIEKEPVYHFYPGTNILCIATPGCSFRCKFCQNWHISQVRPEEVERYSLKPVQIVKQAKREENCIGISYTYTEPTVFYEYMLAISRLAKKEGLKTIVHTCGAMNPEPLKELLPYLDAVTVDLKAFTQKFYDTVIPHASLSHVLNNLKIIKKSGVWLEIVNLIIPTYNDDSTDIRKMCEWIYKNLGPDVPLHFSRFFPHHKFKNLPPTPIETLELAKRIAKSAGLNYVTIGNVPGHSSNSTFCPKCGKVVIKRFHFKVLENNILNGKCKFCGTNIPGVWK
ncbi:AmmeMemoRadiSam system radical SAM enzyme [candidate division WOR-3 bacterium]|nr:AmmeMemoRadiSam system radical SAM enzyme [candidate division WOR-3 bacterium]